MHYKNCISGGKQQLRSSGRSDRGQIPSWEEGAELCRLHRRRRVRRALSPQPSDAACPGWPRSRAEICAAVPGSFQPWLIGLADGGAAARLTAHMGKAVN